MQFSRLVEESINELRRRVDIDFRCDRCQLSFCDPRLLKCHNEKVHLDTVKIKAYFFQFDLKIAALAIPSYIRKGGG